MRAVTKLASILFRAACFVALLAVAPAHAAPAFDDYPALEQFRSKPRAVDFSGDATARTALGPRARQLIRQEAAKGPNFAGAYRLVELGCGTGCQAIFVISLATGRVFQLREGATYGVDMRVGSRLIVISADPVNKIPAKYFVFERGQFRAVR